MNRSLFCEEMINNFSSFKDRDAIICNGSTETYSDLIERIKIWQKRLVERGVKPGMVITVAADYGIDQIALLLALIMNRNIVSPISEKAHATSREYVRVANSSHIILFDGKENWLVEENRERLPDDSALIGELRANERPGLILFSSGSTGVPKAILLDFEKLLQKFKKQRKPMRTLVFLLLDHIGGINTLFAVLSQGGSVLTPTSRQPDAIAAAIAEHKIQLLPTTPTFLKMLLISGAWRTHDLSSLEVVTYGTEPMPQSVLTAVNETLPHVTLKQTYGLSELGIMSTQSKSSNSTLVKIGGEGFEYKIVENVLWVKSRAAMLGYLNYDDPFLEHGWYNTGDRVEVEGDYMRILGRDSEMINVGGEKVHPNEVESVLLAAPNVAAATVSGKRNPVTGNIVVADIRLIEDEDRIALKKRLRTLCQEQLEPYKVPMLFTLGREPLHGERFKKIRLKSTESTE